MQKRLLVMCGGRTVLITFVKKCRTADGHLLFLISESEERANNHQKQNTVTLQHGAETSSSLKRNKLRVARREEPVYAGFELGLVGAERYRGSIDQSCDGRSKVQWRLRLDASEIKKMFETATCVLTTWFPTHQGCLSVIHDLVIWRGLIPPLIIWFWADRLIARFVLARFCIAH